MTDIYLTISLSTHNRDDTPQNYDPQEWHGNPPLKYENKSRV